MQHSDGEMSEIQIPPNTHRYFVTCVGACLAILVLTAMVAFAPDDHEIRRLVSWIYSVFAVMVLVETGHMLWWIGKRHIVSRRGRLPSTVTYDTVSIFPSIPAAIVHSYPYGQYCYLIQDASVTRFFKIGRTNNPGHRMTDFGVLLPFKISIVHIIPCQDSHALESQLHQKYRNRRVRGEWFALTNEDVSEILAMGITDA